MKESTLKKNRKVQSIKSEIIGEVLNAVTHGIGVALAITALVLLLMKAVAVNNTTQIIAFSVYGASLILLFWHQHSIIVLNLRKQRKYSNELTTLRFTY